MRYCGVLFRFAFSWKELHACYRTDMSRFDAKVREFLERVWPGQSPELVRETDWSFVYRGEKSYARLSKFFLDDTFAVKAADVREKWPRMSDEERLDFVSNFWVKKNWTDDDTEILEIIIQDGNGRLWEGCTQAFLKHPDRDRALNFLIRRLEEHGGDEPLNTIHALGVAKDKRATPAIRPYFDKYRKAVEKEKETGVPDDVVFGPIPYHAYFTAAGALLKIEGTPEYEGAIRAFLNHPNTQVRWWAKYALQGDEPR